MTQPVPSRNVARVTVVLVIVPMMLWTFFSTLIKGIGAAIVDTWLELRIEFAELVTTWEHGFKKDGGRHDDWE